MRRLSNVSMTLVLLLLAASGAGQPVGAQEEEKTKKWTHDAELGIVATSGNSNSTTIGVGDKSVRTWGEKADLTLKLEAIANGLDVIQPD